MAAWSSEWQPCSWQSVLNFVGYRIPSNFLRHFMILWKAFSFLFLLHKRLQIVDGQKVSAGWWSDLSSFYSIKWDCLDIFIAFQYEWRGEKERFLCRSYWENGSALSNIWKSKPGCPFNSLSDSYRQWLKKKWRNSKLTSPCWSLPLNY